MGHREEAERYLEQARRHDHLDMQAAVATAHAVLALLDYLQEDDNPDYSDAIPIAVEDRYKTRIAELEKQLETTRATLRAHEAAVGDSMRQRKIEDAGQL